MAQISLSFVLFPQFYHGNVIEIIKEGSRTSETTWKKQHQKIELTGRRKILTSVIWNRFSLCWQIAGDLWACVRWNYTINLSQHRKSQSFIFILNFSLLSRSRNFLKTYLRLQIDFEMNKNAYVSEHGELSTDILLNVAEILALRLPEGAGKNFI